LTQVDQQLFYNLVTRDALLIYDGVARPLEGPYQSREEAEAAAAELIQRLLDDGTNPESQRPL
jgi:hypothetical protein